MISHTDFQRELGTTKVPQWHTQYQPEQRPSHNKWTRFRRGDCPICQGERKTKDCRQSPKGLIHCRSGKDAPPGWHFLGEDKIGFGLYAPGTHQSSSHTPLPVRPTKKTIDVLSDQERDRQFRQIAKHSGLSSNHRTKLKQRGLSPATIEQWYQNKWVWSWANGEQIPGTSVLLPGVNPTTGKLRSDFWGYAIAIPSANGEILGAQIKPNHGGGYFWVSSTSINGNDQRLANGETPIGLYGHHSPTL